MFENSVAFSPPEFHVHRFISMNHKAYVIQKFISCHACSYCSLSSQKQNAVRETYKRLPTAQQQCWVFSVHHFICCS
uniref:Uncharacterized protein n=1 Tax=Arundo donax TaxID=35708 RepID=A0A0A9DWS0_ARUDO